MNRYKTTYLAGDEPYTPVRGFTIVELLIVIVVIGILASVTVVAYGGVSDRAEAARAASLASSYVKLFEMHKVRTGSYPGVDSGMSVCLGDMSAYPGTSDFEVGSCASWAWHADEGSRFSHSVLPEFNEQLVDDTTSLPSGALNVVQASSILKPGHSSFDDWHQTTGWGGFGGGSARYRGMLYHMEERWDESTDDWGVEPHIHYYVRGKQHCPQGDAYSYSGLTECILSLQGSEVDDWAINGGEGG